jgi:hypothetical protein
MVAIDRSSIGRIDAVRRIVRMMTAPKPAPLPPAAPEWLAGLWRRDALVFPDGRADRTTQVLWGQTRSLYVDLRIPAERPAVRGRRSFADFSHAELLQLTDQKGFAGHLVIDGNLCTWVRYIDYRPSTGRPDSGRLRFEGETLYEEGDPSSVLASAYQETYHRERRADRRSVALRSVAADPGSADPDTADAVLVLIDDCFLFARGRAAKLPVAESLRALVLAAGDDRTAIHAYFDCEISLGGTEGNTAWQILASTNPFREGWALLPRASVELAAEPGMLIVRSDQGAAHWQIVESTVPPAELTKLLARGSGRDK